ncbi:MAG: GNAT family N-acetyltransferase [Anaerolineaceae bacterium]|nr:GNAT family N-acetyltransferase [Anaerolineaceae bacterium]
MLFLTEADIRYQDTYLDGMREFQAEGRYMDWMIEDLVAQFPRFVQNLHARKTHPQPGNVPETVYWLVENETFIGRLSLRHGLTEGLNLLGGNIGYEIRPSRRRLGYGTAILRLGLEKARDLGLERVLVTCDDTNIGSIKIIEANGGVWQNTNAVPGHSVPVRRYWITLV